MLKNHFLKLSVFLLIVLIFLVSCKNSPPELNSINFTVTPRTCPEFCENKNICTTSTCSKNTDFKCEYKEKTPCCGNNICERTETYELCNSDCKKPEIQKRCTIVYWNSGEVFSSGDNECSSGKRCVKLNKGDVGYYCDPPAELGYGCYGVCK